MRRTSTALRIVRVPVCALSTASLGAHAQTTATWPGARFGHGMAYHAGTGATVVFGGERTVEGRTRLGETWLWDGTRWSLAAALGPSPRMDVAMVYDQARDRIVLFGGQGPNGQMLADTWEWDGRAWAKRDDGTPGVRMHPVMAYDATRRRIVLVGGAGDGGWLTDTWEWDGTRWERRATTGPAFMASAAYDASRNAVVALTVPAQDGSPANGMVTWTGAEWRPLPVASVPPVEPLVPLVAGPMPNALVTYRSNYRGGDAATWLWNGSTWASQGASAITPGPLLAYAAAFDARRQRVVLFGGLRLGEVATDALWEWGPDGWVERRP